MSKIGFIGCGNMGGTLAKAAAKTCHEIHLSDYSEEKLKAVAKELEATASTNEDIVKNCDMIFLGVKPQVLAEVLEPLKDAFKNRTTPFTVVSMAAGVTLQSVCEMLDGEYPTIRIMPNTPAAVESGMILYCKNGLVTDADVKLFLDSMQFAGICDFIDESLFDAATAVSGCVPA
ncbi:MAG: NAD(P)-binding domain-containing protein, partial [Clostridia bacterium]|nr:NAD(P)-binding domain-containing protein [Clostridia bacterium]